MDVREAVAECGRARQGLATTAALHAAGVRRSGLTRAVARGEVLRVRPGVYATRPLAPWPAFVVTGDGVAGDYVQRVRAVLLSLGPGAVAGGRTAACLRGWGLLVEPLRTVEVAVHGDRGRVRLPGVRAVRRRRLASDEVRPVGEHEPVAVTTALATVVDCCTSLPLLEAVVVCDSALRSGEVALAELEAVRSPGRHAARTLRRVLGLCDPESGSVLESVLRVLMLQAGLTGFATQRVVRDASGRYVRRVDFCFEQARLVVEADGARWHTPVRDQQVDNRLAAAGWRVLRFTWSEVVHDPAAVLSLLRAALEPGSRSTHLAPSTTLRAA